MCAITGANARIMQNVPLCKRSIGNKPSQPARCATRIVASSNNGVTSNKDLVQLLQNVANGVLTAEDAAVQLDHVSGGYKEATPAAKAGFPEVVWGEGKSAQQIATSLQRIADRQGLAAATRVDGDAAAAVQQIIPDAQYNATANMLVLKSTIVKQKKLPGTVAILSAGTANPTVVEECRLMLQCMGCYCFKLPESGVMGMHRIVQNLDAVMAADVVVCVTGTDGGIVSVVGGMVDCPVIALPTSSGYGTAFGGVAPMLAALNSSAPGITVVNIDSGFGASMAAWRILKNASKIRAALAPPVPVA